MGGQNCSPLAYICTLFPKKHKISSGFFNYKWKNLCNQDAFFKNENWKKERQHLRGRQNTRLHLYSEKKTCIWPSNLSGLWCSSAHTHLHLWLQTHQKWFIWVKTKDLAIINSVCILNNSVQVSSHRLETLWHFFFLPLEAYIFFFWKLSSPDQRSYLD